MPRKPRLDFRGMLHHVMARGIDRQEIFRDDGDRDDFLKRLSFLCADRSFILYAWALMPNHFHLLLRTGHRPLSRSMRSLLTGYAGAFNRRHRRTGHLFQNRYKSILCEEDTYFLELVRYLHLNPLRAGIVKDAKTLEDYPYTGHSAILGKRARPWQDTEEVLLRFSPQPATARASYQRFVADGAAQGRRPDLMGGGLLRSAGGWKAVAELRRGREKYASDERVLGSTQFVETLMRRLEQEENAQIPLNPKRWDIALLFKRVSRQTGIRQDALSEGGRSPALCRAREGMAYLWVEMFKKSGRELAAALNVRPESIYKAAKRGSNSKHEWEHLAKLN